MKRYPRQTWLFSFVDIAFLLLLVYTQLARMDSADVTAAEIRLPAPEVANNPEVRPRKAGKDYRQILVEKHSEKPFRLTRISGGAETARSDSMDAAGLEAALAGVLAESGTVRPVIVPLPESFSSDLLQATALVGKRWHEGDSAIVHIKRSDKK